MRRLTAHFQGFVMELNEPGSELRNALDAITSRVIKAAREIHGKYGPVMLEKAYQDCMDIEFRFRRIPFEAQVYQDIEHRSVRIPKAYLVDFIVESAVIVELKTVEKILPVHDAQVLTYMKLTGCRAGLLINFRAEPLSAGIRRFNM
jgi:GxxExxY protein